MTATHPSAGTPAALRAAARPFAATARAIAATVIAAALVLAPSVSGVRAETTPTPSPTSTPLSGEVTLTAAPNGNGAVTPGASLSVRIVLDNGTTRAQPERLVSLLIGRSPLLTRDALTDWLSGSPAVNDTDSSDAQQVATATIPGTESGESASGTAVIEADAPALSDREPGVYPLLARTPEARDQPLSARSVVIVPAGDAAGPVGIVVPVTAGPITGGLLTSDELVGLTAADGRLTAVLDAVSGTSAVLAVDPAVVAAIRVLGTSAPLTATQWLEKLLSVPNERFALQFGDADVAAQLRSTAAVLAEPTSLTAYMNSADFPDSEPAPTPTPSTSPVEVVTTLPGLPALLDIGATRPGVYWPISGTADAAVLSVLGKQSPDAEQPISLVPSATIESTGARTALQRAADADVLVYDSTISVVLRDAAIQSDPTTRGASLTAATAYLSLAAGTAGPRLVVIDRADQYSRAGLRAAITTVTQAPGARAATLAQLTAGRPGSVSIMDVDIDAGADRASAASQLVSDEDTLRSFSTILDDPEQLLGPERASVMQLLGAGYASDPDRFAVALTDHRAATAATLDDVGILPPTSTNLITSDAGLGFWVRNDLPWPINVVLDATPDDVRLEVEPRTPVRVDAASNKRTEVQVRSLVGNGEVQIALRLHSASGEAIGAGQQVDVNVRAEWEVVGIVILGVLVAVLLGLGLVRTVLHRRWLARQESGDADAGSPATDTPERADASTRIREDPA